MYSLTYISGIVLFITFLSKLLNWEIGSEELTVTVQTILGLLSALGVFFGRWRIGGISIWGVKK